MAFNYHTHSKTGEMSLVGKRFSFWLVPTGSAGTSINFVTASGNIAFHFNPRINENQIVCNTEVNGQWGREERTPIRGFFRIGGTTKVTIRFQMDSWFVEADDNLLLKYFHRIPCGEVTRFNIKNFDLKHVEIQ